MLFNWISCFEPDTEAFKCHQYTGQVALLCHNLGWILCCPLPHHHVPALLLHSPWTPLIHWSLPNSPSELRIRDRKDPHDFTGSGSEQIIWTICISVINFLDFLANATSNSMKITRIWIHIKLKSGIRIRPWQKSAGSATMTTTKILLLLSVVEPE